MRCYLIAKGRKVYTIGETLLLPAAIKMYGIVHGENYSLTLKVVAFVIIP
jgi:hypothetical protein